MSPFQKVGPLLFLACLSVHAVASSTAHINYFTVRNDSPYLIASDALQNGDGYDRDAIHLEAAITFSASPSNQYGFDLRFSLLDSSGSPVRVIDENGQPAQYLTVMVDFPSLSQSVLQVMLADLVPYQQLDHFSAYTPRVEVFETSVGGAPVGPNFKAGQNHAPRTFLHFLSTNDKDQERNILANLSGVFTSRNYMVVTASGLKEFAATVRFTLHRHDQFTGRKNPEPKDPVAVQLVLTLTNAQGTAIPLETSVKVIPVEMARYAYDPRATPERTPAEISFTETINFNPRDPTDLVIGETYSLGVTLSHEERPQEFKAANRVPGTGSQLRYLNGTLFFGGVPSRLEKVNHVEVPGTVIGGVAMGLLIPGKSGGRLGNYTYGDGNSGLQVAIHANGDAFFTGSLPGVEQLVLTPATTPDRGQVAGVEYAREELTLTTTGATGRLRVYLPAGLGYTRAAARKILYHELVYPEPISFNGALDPIPATLSFSLPADTWFCEESKPLLLAVDQLDWDIATGRFTLLPAVDNAVQYVRADELDFLESLENLDNSHGAQKRSNELYWRRVASTTSPTILVEPGEENEALMTFSTGLSDPDPTHEFYTHFPYNAHISWSGPARLHIEADRIDPTLSHMEGVDPIRLEYARDCGGSNCGSTVQPASLSLVPNGNRLVFTEDGGLVQRGLLEAISDLTWGYIPVKNDYAQKAIAFLDARFVAAGHFQGTSSMHLSSDHGAGSILLSGVWDTGLVGEVPGSNAYLDGMAWYAGLNFEVSTDGANQGHSVIGGDTNIKDYPLTSNSKYYVRKSGVSGIHQAMEDTFIPEKIYGYGMTFATYGISYLDSRQVDAATTGNLTLDDPAGFDLDFTRIRLDCLGALQGADVADGPDKTLAYWQGDFTPLTLSFARNANSLCNPGTGFLAVGVAAYMSHTSSVFHGELGFKTDGNLITPNDNLVAGLESKLSGPNRIRFAGLEDEVYSMDLAGKLFYNNPDEAADASGFLNLPGRIDVPFFSDIKVHLQTSGDRDSTIAPLHLMGGWPNHGYGTEVDNFFTSARFDSDHKGYAGASVQQYRNSGSEDYLPRAQQKWLGVVDFDYPLQWSDFKRSFSSMGAHEDRLLIVDTEHDLSFLSASQAELSFGLSWDGVPQLSLANLASELAEDTLFRPFRAVVDEGKEAMSELLSDKVQNLFDPILDELLDPLLDDLYQSLREVYEDAAAYTPENELLPFDQWRTAYAEVVACYLTGETGAGQACLADVSLLGLLGNVIGTVDDVAGLLAQIDAYLEKAEQLLEAFTRSFKDPEGRILSDTRGLFVCDENGDIDVALAEELLKRLLREEDVGIDPAILGRLIDDLMGPVLEDAKPTLKKLAERLLEFRAILGEIRSEYLGPASEFVMNLSDQLAQMNDEINMVVSNADQALETLFTEMEELTKHAGSPFTEYSAEAFKTRIKAEIKDAFYSSEIGTRLQRLVKQLLQDTNSAICQGIDNVFAQLNQIVRDLLTSALQELDEQLIPFLDDLNDVVGAGGLTGYAHIAGDAIRYARMDAHLEWSVPKKMDFDGFIEIKQLNAEGSGNACYTGAAGTINEVVIGANHVPINWGDSDIKADIYAKATFDTGSGVKLVGIGGGFDMVEGEISFENFTITEFGAALALGEQEAFLAARARATFDGVEAAIGAFFGKTCTLEPLAVVDSDVASIIGDPPFSGAYLYGEAWIPIFDFGCLLRLKAGAGIGVGYFSEGPTYVGKMKLGISGEAICVVSVRGDLVLVGVKRGSEFRFKGTGTVTGKIGACSWFCIKFKKSITVEK